MLINSPSNPTGQMFSKSTAEAIVTFCQNHHIVLISDEIYSDLCFTDADQLDDKPSPYAVTEVQSGMAIMTGGLSKASSRPVGDTMIRILTSLLTDLLCWRLENRLRHVSQQPFWS